MSNSNMITIAQLHMPEFHTEDGRKVLDQLLGAPDLDDDAIAAYYAGFCGRTRGLCAFSPTRLSEAVGNYVFGSAYAPFDAPSPDYRAPGKFASVAAELSHPLSRGSVHITSARREHANTNKGVRIGARNLSHPLDLEVLARQVRFTEDLISRAEPITRYLKPYTKRFTNLHITKDYVRRTVDGAYHYTGTCSMMLRTMGGVANNKLRI
ncbi:hypothetical protein F4802DRAFT_562986 [Xylaria palmicola]|nr:hypothetical protein F4802DRAFT_562986 [Xylaria palmicola]